MMRVLNDVPCYTLELGLRYIVLCGSTRACILAQLPRDLIALNYWFNCIHALPGLYCLLIYIII